MPYVGKRKCLRRSARTSEPSQRHFRLTDGELETLSDEFHTWRLEREGRGSSPASSFKHVRLFVSYISSGGYFREVGLKEGVAESTAQMYCAKVADYLVSTANTNITLPTSDELESLATNVNGRRAILYVDGCIVAIQRPDNAGNAYYCGRPGKAQDSLNIQAVCDKTGRVRHIVSGVSGAAHDKTALEFSSRFMKFLEDLPAPFCVIGDAAYRGMGPAMMTPYTGRGLTLEQQAFNKHITRNRQIIERVFGDIECKFQLDQMKENRIAAKKNVEYASKCCIAIAVLHNRFTNFL